ncbi:hypothetical protein DMN91_003467 [Ooceraea biroi]|uniref:Uncharacterized protein n=1 Tax=Ooceraea biroi TaxID=2015173 RepID=A0A3L8DS79_OOCBI|nr:hypothetical protein DMN91_003467 [Ooceraea biroi]
MQDILKHGIMHTYGVFLLLDELWNAHTIMVNDIQGVNATYTSVNRVAYRLTNRGCLSTYRHVFLDTQQKVRMLIRREVRKGRLGYWPL